VNAPDPHVPLASSAPSRMERLFPTLTGAQIARIAARGRRRTIARGEVLVEVGDKDVPFFVVVSGEFQALRPSGATETLIVAHGPGQFTGEAIMITGRRAMGRLRVSGPGEVIELEREQLRALMQTDAELSEILMRAFMVRRVELIAHEFGDVVVLGSTRCAGTLRVTSRIRDEMNDDSGTLTGAPGDCRDETGKAPQQSHATSTHAAARLHALRFGRPSESGMTIESQEIVDRADGRRTLADRCRDSFGRSGADVADSEQSGMAGFKRQRGAPERFPGPMEVLAPDGSIRAHKPSIVERGKP
jgi:CRP-like cAMP-binding protein